MADDFIKSSKAFLGRGWSFPPTFFKGGDENSVKMLEAEEDIQSSLNVLLTTTVGERIMQPDFGANLNSYVFDSMDTTFQTFISQQIRNAIAFNEPRVNVDTIDYEDEPENGRVMITVNYTVISTNTRYNIVFPFYLSEGTELPPQ